MKKYLIATVMAVTLTAALPAAAHAGCSISGTVDSSGGGSVTVSCELF